MIPTLHPLDPRRLFAAGDLVDTFGHHGLAFTPYELYQADLSVVRPTPAGKLLAGVADQSYRKTRPGVDADFVQYNADGSPDESFGTAGHADSFFTTVRQITVRSDGKFFALGSDLDFSTVHGGKADDVGVVSGNTNWYVALFRADGTPDRSFGDRGRVKLDLPPSVQEIGTRLSTNASSFLDANGRVTLLADYRADGPKSGLEPAIFRFTADGSPDPRFYGGPLRLQGRGERLSAESMALTQGSLFVTGVRSFRHRDTTFLERISTDGNVVPSFGTRGRVTVASAPATAPAVSVAADGGVFVSADAPETVDGTFHSTDYLRKFHADGTTDATFGDDGLVTPAATGTPLSLPDGGVVVYDGYDRTQRFNARGKADPVFGTVGAFASYSPVVVGDAIYAPALTQYQKNRRGKRVDRGYVVALSLGDAGGRSPVTVSGGHVRFVGTSDDDRDMQVSAGATYAAPTALTFNLDDEWSRTIPLAGVTTIDLYGEAGDDDLIADLKNVKGVTTVLHGGPGADALNGTGPNITGYGDAGNDVVQGDIKNDGNAE